MKKTILFFTFVLPLALNAQQWSEPVQVANTGPDMFAQSPYFTQDSNGTLHCVWCQVHRENLGDGHVFYSSSDDEGLTWSQPEIISQNDDYRPNNTQVLAINSTVHVLYDFNTSDPGKTVIVHTMKDGNSWTIPDTVSGENTGKWRCKATTDNEKVYVFWYDITGPCTRFRVYDDEWGEIQTPYGYEDGHTHCDFVYSSTDKKIYGAFNFFYSDYGNQLAIGTYDTQTGLWSDLAFDSTHVSDVELSVGHDNILHIADIYSPWLEMNMAKAHDSKLQDSLFYLMFKEGIFSNKDTVVTGTIYDHEITMDKKNKQHLFLYYYNPEQRLVHLIKNNDMWIGEEIDSASNLIRIGNSICSNNTLMLLYKKSSIPMQNTNIIFRKLILPDYISSINYRFHFCVYPNPAKNKVQVRFSNISGTPAHFYITTLNGAKVANTRKNPTQEGHLVIDTPLPPGQYFITMQCGNKLITKSFVKL